MEILKHENNRTEQFQSVTWRVLCQKLWTHGCDLPIVSTSSDHADVAQLKLDKLLGLARLNVQHDGVIHLVHVVNI